MAKTSLKVKQQRKPKYSTRAYTRCRLCGRPDVYKRQIPLPTEKEVVTILRAVHKYKDSREQFEQRTHKRLIDITNATLQTTDALTKLDLPAGVDIEIKL